MEKTQKIFFFIGHAINQTSNASELNSHLKDGWKVVSVTPTSGADTSYTSAVIVVEK